MALPTNTFKNVQTFQDSNLAYLQNHFCFLDQSNKKFKNFNTIEANLGDTVTFDLPPRYTTSDTLIATFQDSTQRPHSLTIDKAKNVAALFSSEQLILNVKDYMPKFGASAMKQLGTTVEADIAQNAITNTFRHYGDGIAAINSFGQLAEAVAQLEEFGAAPGEIKGYVSNLAVPLIVQTGLAKFAPKRADDTAYSWELGEWADASWYRSNLLPIHTAGTIGQGASTLTITAFTPDVDGGVTTITCSGGGTNTMVIDDLLQFDDAVPGQPDLRFRTFIGQEPCGSRVQVKCETNVASVADSVTFSFTPSLYSAAGATQNITAAIATGMELTVRPSHRAGLLYSGDALFLAMPKLPTQPPFDTWNKMDDQSGCAMRMTYGSRFGENEQGMVYDTIWGSTLVPEYAMRVLFPL